ncbi:MAG: dihydrodipicolinate synthase family protein [Thermogutta sp.]
MATQPIEGIFSPNMVPLDDRGRINEPELRRYLDWLIAKGIHGLYPNGSTSEFVRFTPEERRRIIEITVDQVAGRVPILAGAAEANVFETIKACEFYAQLGVRAVAIVCPFYYRVSPDNIFSYFNEIAKHSPVDVTIYNIPWLASPLDVATIIRIAEECPRVVAIKDSSGDLPQMMRLMAAIRPRRPDFRFLTGWDAVLFPMLLLGCDGGTNATSGVVPEITRAIFDAVRKGRIDEARRWQYRLLKYNDALFGAGDFPEGFRIGVETRGFRMGRGRQPLSPASHDRLRQLRGQLEELLAEDRLESAAGRFGEKIPRDSQFAGSAVATRPTFSEENVREEVERVVREVVHVLKERNVSIN